MTRDPRIPDFPSFEPLYREAMVIARVQRCESTTRGVGIPVTDKQLSDWIADVVNTYGEHVDGRKAQEVAYYVCRFALSGERFERVWRAFVGSGAVYSVGRHPERV